MARQIAAHYQEASMTVLEERVHHLEAKVATLSDALRALARGLEGGPLAKPGEREMADAARRAYEILLSADLVPPQPAPDTPPDKAEQDPGAGPAAARS